LKDCPVVIGLHELGPVGGRAARAMCRPLHEGHTPRRLHEKATTNVCVQCVRTARANPKQKQPAREIPVELLFDVARNGLLAG
jgi:hypothetical protein